MKNRESFPPKTYRVYHTFSVFQKSFSGLHSDHQAASSPLQTHFPSLVSVQILLPLVDVLHGILQSYVSHGQRPQRNLALSLSAL